MSNNCIMCKVLFEMFMLNKHLMDVINMLNVIFFTMSNSDRFRGILKKTLYLLYEKQYAI